MKHQGFTLRCPAFRPDTFLPTRHTCDGQNVSPELRWSYAPDGVASYAIIMEDIDAKEGAFTHWVLFDLPGDLDGVPADVKELGTPGRNDFQHHKYAGPCPAPNRGQHRYVFRVYALGVATLNLPSGAERALVESAINENVLDQATLTGRFERRTH
jgi:Raf kinase inhibitor-like YbhB/YbcL family protein